MSGVERFAVIELQVGRQSQHEKAIYRGYGKGRSLVRVVTGAAERAKLVYRRGRCTHALVHIDSQAQVAQQEQRLLRRYPMLLNRNAAADPTIMDGDG